MTSAPQPERQQYGTLIKDLVDDISESTVQALYDNQWTTRALLQCRRSAEACPDGLQPFLERLDAVAREDDRSARPETLLRCEDRRGDHHRTTAA